MVKLNKYKVFTFYKHKDGTRPLDYIVTKTKRIFRFFDNWESKHSDWRGSHEIVDFRATRWGNQNTLDIEFHKKSMKPREVRINCGECGNFKKMRKEQILYLFSFTISSQLPI